MSASIETVFQSRIFRPLVSGERLPQDGGQSFDLRRVALAFWGQCHALSAVIGLAARALLTGRKGPMPALQ